MTIAAETIEIMSDEDNCHVRRNFALTAPSRLLYTDKITPDQYRLCEAILQDLIDARGLRTASRLQSVPGGGAYIAMPRSTNSARGPQERVPDASWRIGEAKKRVGAPLAWAMLEDMLMGDYGPTQLERRWKQRNGTAIMTLAMVLDRIADSEVYDETKWRVSVWGAG